MNSQKVYGSCFGEMHGKSLAGDSWHSSKIIRADEKNARIIKMTIFGPFDSGNRVKDPELV
jgi:hypothetical protein